MPAPLAPPSPARARLALAAALGMLAAVATLEATATPLPFLAAAHVARRLVLLLLLLAAFAGWGEQLARWLRLGALGWTARIALGGVFTATLLAWSAPLRFVDALVGAPWVLAGCVLLLAAARRGALRPPAPLPGPPLLWVAAAALLVPALLVALAPPLALDGLVYHLAIPRQAALAGRLRDMPWLSLTAFPLHAEMLYGLTLAFDPGGQLAQLLHLAAAAGTLRTAGALAARLSRPAAAPWAALLLGGVPMLGYVAGAAWNDWFVLLLVALALEAHLDARLETAEADGALRLEAVLLGGAVATKYVALPALALLPMLALLHLRRGARPRALLAAGALATVVAAPWYLRNLLRHGNPVYPLLSGTATGALAQFRAAGSWLDALRGYLFDPQVLDESLGVLLPAAALLALVALAGRRRLPSPLLLLAVLYAVPALLLHPTARAFAPLLLVAAIAGAVAIAELPLRRPARVALGVLAGAALALQLGTEAIVWQLEGDRPLRVLTGLVDEPGYVEAVHPYAAAFRLADGAPAGTGVLLLGEGRAFALHQPAVWGAFLDPDPLAAFAGTPPSAETAAQRLRAAGIGLVYFDAAHVSVGTRPPGVADELRFYRSPALDAVWRELLRHHLRAVFHRGSSWLFVLAPPAAPEAR